MECAICKKQIRNIPYLDQNRKKICKDCYYKTISEKEKNKEKIFIQEKQKK